MMKRRRLLITGVLLLLGGAIVNVAVAWGCALTKPSDAIRLYEALPDPERRAAEYGLQLNREDWRLDAIRARWLGGRCDLLTQLTDGGVCIVTHDGIGIVETGWPVLALVGSYNQYSNGPGPRSLLRIERQRRAAIDLPFYEIPLLPLWPGFAINTIFYAAMLWVVFFVPGMVRRTIRCRRGLCPACAYPIGTSSVCTECGATVLRLPSR